MVEDNAGVCETDERWYQTELDRLLAKGKSVERSQRHAESRRHPVRSVRSKARPVLSSLDNVLSSLDNVPSFPTQQSVNHEKKNPSGISERSLVATPHRRQQCPNACASKPTRPLESVERCLLQPSRRVWVDQQRRAHSCPPLALPPMCPPSASTVPPRSCGSHRGGGTLGSPKERLGANTKERIFGLGGWSGVAPELMKPCPLLDQRKHKVTTKQDSSDAQSSPKLQPCKPGFGVKGEIFPMGWGGIPCGSLWHTHDSTKPLPEAPSWATRAHSTVPGLASQTIHTGNLHMLTDTQKKEHSCFINPREYAGFFLGAGRCRVDGGPIQPRMSSIGNAHQTFFNGPAAVEGPPNAGTLRNAHQTFFLRTGK